MVRRLSAHLGASIPSACAGDSLSHGWQYLSGCTNSWDESVNVRFKVVIPIVSALHQSEIQGILIATGSSILSTSCVCSEIHGALRRLRDAQVETMPFAS